MAVPHSPMCKLSWGKGAEPLAISKPPIHMQGSPLVLSSPNSPIYIPSKPLVQRIDAGGGIAMLLTGCEADNDPTSQEYWRSEADYRSLVSRSEIALRRARKTGQVSVFAADALCIEVLRVHPYQVYPYWFDLTAENAASYFPVIESDVMELAA